MPHKPSFSKDDFLKMEQGWYVFQPPIAAQNPLQEALRASMERRRRFGLKLPKLDSSMFPKS